MDEEADGHVGTQRARLYLWASAHTPHGDSIKRFNHHECTSLYFLPLRICFQPPTGLPFSHASFESKVFPEWLSCSTSACAPPLAHNIPGCGRTRGLHKPAGLRRLGPAILRGRAELWCWCRRWRWGRGASLGTSGDPPGPSL